MKETKLNRCEDHDMIQESNHRPLAEQMRPSHYDQLLGQEGIWGKNGALRIIVEKGLFRSGIFWGPPGCGKTSLAHLIARSSDCPVEKLSAVSCGVKDLRAVIEKSTLRIASGQSPVLLFLDEIHRLSRNQQDILLPSLEEGSLKFIGATSENPSFTVANGVLSRCIVYKLEPLSNTALQNIIKTAIKETYPLLIDKIGDKILNRIALSAGGDARRALNLVEILTPILEKLLSIDVSDNLQAANEQIENELDKIIFSNYDRKGDGHYDNASALIKSIRASHPDAALHYLAKMLVAGEQPEFIARRLIISASEDIGNANPHMLSFAQAAAQSVAMVGMPEARIILGQIVTLLASSPKSNRAYVGINQAMADVKKLPNLAVPLSLRNAPTSLMKESGYGKNYVYAHDDLDKARKQYYMPNELRGKVYYHPSDQGHEIHILETLKKNRPIMD